MLNTLEMNGKKISSKKRNIKKSQINILEPIDILIKIKNSLGKLNNRMEATEESVSKLEVDR